jgi:hypothetical protein
VSHQIVSDKNGSLTVGNKNVLQGIQKNTSIDTVAVTWSENSLFSGRKKRTVYFQPGILLKQGILKRNIACGSAKIIQLPN